jgi:hypothetical protein
MITRRLIALLPAALVVFLLVLHAQDDSGRARIEAVVTSIRAGNVATVEVFGVPADALFAVNLAPASLEDAWDYKIILRFPSGLEGRTEALTAALSSAVIRKSDRQVQTLDVRTGIAFYSKTPKDRRIATFYFTGTGHDGAVNDTAVSFSPGLALQLKKLLRPSI